MRICDICQNLKALVSAQRNCRRQKPCESSYDVEKCLFLNLLRGKHSHHMFYGIVRDTKQFVGKKETFRQKKAFFLRSVRNTVKYFFSWALLWDFGEQLKGLKAMKIQATQLTAVLTAESCVTSIKRIMHRDLMFIFLVFSVTVGVFSVAPSYCQASVYLLLMSHVDTSWMFVGKPQNDFLFSAC